MIIIHNLANIFKRAENIKRKNDKQKLTGRSLTFFKLTNGGGYLTVNACKLWRPAILTE